MIFTKIEHGAGLAFKGLELLVTLACIALAGWVISLGLQIGGVSGLALYALTGGLGLVGGLILKLILRVLIYIFEG